MRKIIVLGLILAFYASPAALAQDNKSIECKGPFKDGIAPTKDELDKILLARSQRRGARF